MRLGFGGFEAQHPVPDAVNTQTFNVPNTTDPITGEASIEGDSIHDFLIVDPEADRTYYGRCRMRVNDWPPAGGIEIMDFFVPSSPETLGIVLRDDGRLTWAHPSGEDQISCKVIAPDAAIVLELSCRYDSSTGKLTLAARLNGAPIRYAPGTDVMTLTVDGEEPPMAFGFGKVFAFGNTSGTDITMDDWAINDDSGAADNGWVGTRSRVALLRPVADGAVGSWTKGAGGTGNLWESLNNTPPTGKFDPIEYPAKPAGEKATDADQIRNNLPSTTDAYEAICESYSAKVPVGATLLRARAAAAVARSRKVAGSSRISYAVSVAADGATWGDEMIGLTPASDGAVFPLFWAFGRTNVGANPIVQPALSDLAGISASTQPLVKIRRDHTSFVLNCCFLGVMVEYDAPWTPPILESVCPEPTTIEAVPSPAGCRLKQTQGQRGVREADLVKRLG